jgi:membrane-associated protease RseP (regulator of RpoE activity)
MDFRNFWPAQKRGRGVASETKAENPDPLEPPRQPRFLVNIILFLATVATTILAGAMLEGVNPLESPERVFRGIPFSFSLMGILLAHELGHYWMARRHGLNVTLPYFIPAPPFIIGTLGAIIKIRSPVRNRRMLLDVGATGPLVGVIFAVPVLILGLRLSEVKMIQGEGAIHLGSSLLLSLISWLVVGPLPEGYDVMIHPVGLAGWFGLLVTSFNLIPIGQLDGGHVAYALLGKWQNRISFLGLFVLLGLGIFAWPGWLVWLFLLVIMGFRHPAPLEEGVTLDRKRQIIGWIAVGIFILTFVPVPMNGF